MPLTLATQYSFDNIYRNKADYYGRTPTRSLQRFVEEHNLRQGKALDIGCGQGRDSLYLAQRGFRVTAVDISEEGFVCLNQHADEQGIKINCIPHNVMTYDFPQAEFDFINASTLLDHLDRDDILDIIMKIKQTLAPGGFGHIMVFNKQDPGYHFHKECDINYQTKASETVDAVVYYFDGAHELRWLISPDDDDAFKVLSCKDESFLSRSHGDPHTHHVSIITFQKK